MVFVMVRVTIGDGFAFGCVVCKPATLIDRKTVVGDRLFRVVRVGSVLWVVIDFAFDLSLGRRLAKRRLTRDFAVRHDLFYTQKLG